MLKRVQYLCITPQTLFLTLENCFQSCKYPITEDIHWFKSTWLENPVPSHYMASPELCMFFQYFFQLQMARTMTTGTLSLKDWSFGFMVVFKNYKRPTSMIHVLYNTSGKHMSSNAIKISF